jgi:hypothetical protein
MPVQFQVFEGYKIEAAVHSPSDRLLINFCQGTKDHTFFAFQQCLETTKSYSSYRKKFLL